jgi:hypothetical protein
VATAARIGMMILGVTVALVVLAAALAVLAWTLVAVPAWVLLAMGTTSDEPPVTPPLASLNVTRHHGRPTEIHATLAVGQSLADLVNLHLFDGFEAWMRPEAAELRFGPPAGLWKVPPRKAPESEGLFGSRHSDELAPYYERPEGRVTLRPFPTPEQGTNWALTGYPKDRSLEHLFPDVRLRSQLANVLPTEGFASLNIHSSDGWGALVVSLNRSECEDIELRSRTLR